MHKVVIAEDHEMVRIGLRMMLDASGRYSVAGETPHAHEVEALIRDTGAAIAVVDQVLGESSGLDLATQLRKSFPFLKIVLATGSALPGGAEIAFAAGADGFLIKRSRGAELLDALDAVMAGQRYAGARHDLDSPGAAELLSEREKEILRLVARGRTTREIADDLDIGVLAARKYRSGLVRKLDTGDDDGLVAYARSAGLGSS
ncbi:MAG: response regulator transcription factor [Burkholderiaceae bacterium]